MFRAHEMFGDPKWTKWWLYTHPVKYTSKRNLADKIAQKMAGDIQYLEHGIIRFFSDACLDDCVLKGGELFFPKPVEYPTHRDEDCDEGYWEIIEYTI